ncbi:hypothetical protein, partial [Stieleria sp.]|uniref:hypothetical protein n=1 Tax=Stieleria sp. TaxID=2795976 RepID=UPI0035686E66
MPYFCRLVLLIGSAAFVAAGTSPAQTLSKEGQDQKATHDYLFDTFLEGRETKFVGSGRDRGLKEVTVMTETKEIRHGDEVLLPEGAERVA